MGIGLILLLDTHIWLRWQNVGTLPFRLVERIETAERVAVSVISCWELAQLHRRKKIELPLPIAEWIALASIDIEILPLDKEVALLAETLSFHHKDPADRFIIATSVFYQMPIISLDTVFPKYEQIAHLLINK